MRTGRGTKSAIAHQMIRVDCLPKDYEVIPDGDGHFERHVYEGGSSRDFFVLLLLTSEAGHAQFDILDEGGQPDRPSPGYSSIANYVP